MEVTVCRPSHMSSRAYPGVLLQHARDWSFSTSLFHSRSRYAHSCHTAAGCGCASYPSCECLRTMSRDELMSSFCERPTAWGERLFTPCWPFAKGPKFMNMVMTFVLHPLSYYNSITKPRAWFLLSLLEHLTINFPSHFILSILDVHLDSASRDKLIFPSAIMRILRHFSIPFPSSDHFTIKCAIDYATIKRSEAQFRSQQMDSIAPSSRSTPSRSTPSASAPSSLGDVSLGDVMAQLQRMDARLGTLSMELYQVNVRVGRIARRQAALHLSLLLHHLIQLLLILMLRMIMMMMMVMTMTLQMMIEMLALPMRCLLDTLPFVTCDKKRE